MAAKQTRRSISIRGLTYQRIKNYVEANGGTISGFVENTIEENMGPPTDEDRQKFGEVVEQREKDSKKAPKAKEESDELEDYIPPIQFF